MSVPAPPPVTVPARTTVVALPPAPAPKSAPAPAPAPKPEATSGQRNALAKAQDYLAFTAFSRSGLIQQLKYEGFTFAQVQYGADAAY